MEKIEKSKMLMLLKQVVNNKKYKWFDSGVPYNLNIIGIRSGSKITDTFDDMITVSYFDGDEWQCQQFYATVDAGLFYYLHPMNVEGTASVTESQHLSTFGIGLHKNEYRCLIQIKEIEVKRVVYKQGLFITGRTETGFYGIHIHRASSIVEMNTVGRYSAGCQVIQNFNDFDLFMSIIDKSVEQGFKPVFTYTLINEQDIEDAKQQVGI